MTHRILIVEDDSSTVRLLQRVLEPEGFAVTTVTDGVDALKAATRDQPNLVILDRRLPGLDGLEVCRRLRATSPVPILMLTAAAEEIDKILGLSLGADDYVTKPFSPREVLARVKAILNRAARQREDKILRHRDLEMDLERHKVSVGGKELDLTASEFKLLHALIESPGRVFSRSELLDRMYPRGESAVVDRAIDVHMGNLRRKLNEDPGHPRFIDTVRGVGYRLL